MSNDNIGQNIQYYRKKAHLTQEQLAELSGVTVNYLSKVERNVVKNFSAIIMIRIAESLNVSADDLVYRGKHKKLKIRPNQKRLNNLLNQLDDSVSEQLAESFINTIQTASKINLNKKNDK